MFNAIKDGRIQNPIILEISPDVIFFKNTLFSNQNATKSGVIISGTSSFFNSLRFDLFKKNYFDLNIDEKPFFQAEVLVLQSIPMKYIINLQELM